MADLESHMAQSGAKLLSKYFHSDISPTLISYLASYSKSKSLLYDIFRPGTIYYFPNLH